MKKRILIVDNDRQLNKINEKVLHSAGIVSELHIANNGREALDYLTSRLEKQYPLPHIIIFDLDLPVLDGFKFIDKFHSLDFPGKSAIELVVFTASSNPKDKQKVSSRGIKHYLSKPYLLRGLNDILLHMKVNPDIYGKQRRGFETIL